MFLNTIIKINDVLFDIQTFPLLPTIIFLVLLSIIWDIIFIKKIRFHYYLYSKLSQLPAAEFSENSLAAVSQHKIEVIKYSFLLALNIFEVFGAFAYGFGAELADIFFQTNNTIMFPNKFNNVSCIKELVIIKDLQLSFVTEVPIVLICVSFGQVCLLVSLSLSICLMKFLFESYYDKTSLVIKWIKRFLLLTLVFSVFIFVFGSIPHVLIVHHIFEPIIQFAYFCLWLKYVRLFYRLLKRKTIDLRLDWRNKGIIRRSMISEKQFAIITFLNTIGVTCFILSELIAQYSMVLSTILYFGPCLFTYLFGTASYAPILDHQQSEWLYTFILVINVITVILVMIACTAIGTHYFLASFIYFGAMLVRKLKIRFGIAQRTRFTPSPSQPLLFQQQIQNNYL